MAKFSRTKKQRLADYKELIKYERKNKYEEGICIVLGDTAVQGGFQNAPWTYWYTLVDYYPELKVYRGPAKFTSFTIHMRKKVIESLAARLSKKKDPYRDSKIFVK